MARHGNSRHLNRLASSTYPRVSKKISKYIAKPAAGRHALGRSIALVVLVRDKLGLAATAGEVRKIINAGGVQVNGRLAVDDRYPLGFGDVVTFAGSKESYSIGIDKAGNIKLDKASGRAGSRTLKVVGKYVGRGNKVMLRLYDGSTVKGEAATKVNDSVVLNEKGIGSVLKFEKGARCLVIAGTHASERGVIKEVKQGNATSLASVKIEGEGGAFETSAENIMVIGA
ncbi:MAG: hypothetical protein KGI04_01850 [Candidatus Micrarchaeota archaeon]|nr:hypothetical protein [Candidatus Micrarchaeota archaeon]